MKRWQRWALVWMGIDLGLLVYVLAALFGWDLGISSNTSIAILFAAGLGLWWAWDGTLWN